MRERRYKKTRNPKRVFLVLCEGETEKTYIETLKRHFRLPVAIKAKVSGANINARLVNQYLHELGLENPRDYRVFFVYDSDVQPVVDRLRELQGEAILTNPCIELWYLLHVRDHSRMQTSEEILRLLKATHSVWAGYTKGILSRDQQRHLLERYADAKVRASRLSWPNNPSSNFYDFIKALEEEAEKS